MQEILYFYDGSFEGFLSCVFESYAHHERPTAIESDEVPTLFASRWVETEVPHAQRVLRKLHAVSPWGLELVRRGFLTCLPRREMALYRLIQKLLEEGPAFLHNLSDETLNPVFQAVRHLNGEAHLLKGFVRFSDYGGVLAAEIEPKNRVLPLLRGHFCSRFQNEDFLIYDRVHHEVLLSQHGASVIRPLDALTLAAPDQTEAAYRRLWKRFYDTVAIRERYNPKLRRTHMPKRYWNTMTEFQGEDYFRAAEDAAAVPAPGAPGGIPAPGRPPAPLPSAPGSSRGSSGAGSSAAPAPADGQWPPPGRGAPPDAPPGRHRPGSPPA